MAFFKDMLQTFSIGLLLVIALHCHVGKCTDERNGQSDEERRQLLVKNIINKLTNLSLSTIITFHNTSLGNKPLILDKIRSKLRLISNSTGLRQDKYVKLVMDGILQSITARKRISKLESSITENEIEENVKQEHENELPTKSNALRASVRSHNKSYKPTNSIELEEETTGVPGEDSCDCSCVEGKLCSKIASLSQFTCRRDQNVIPLTKLCDGKYNCKDKSDENGCRVHANKILSDAKRIITEIKNILPKRCLEVQSITDKVIISTNELVFEKVLKTQVRFLNMVSPIKYHMTMAKPVKEVNEITIIVSSVGAALEGALCIRRKIYKKVSNSKSGTSFEEHVVFKQQKSWVPPLCTCVNRVCEQKNCSSECSNTCWQRYSLGQWVCKAITGARSVSLDLICDGKVDCLDESDENGCTSGAAADKFEATQMYNIIMEVLTTKTSLTEFHYLLNKFIHLQESVRRLQAQTMVQGTNAPVVKYWRDEVVAGLLSIYEDILVNADNIDDIDSGYNFLMSVSLKLVEAMKRSKTGNDRFVSSNDCQCVGDKCVLIECSELCVRSCAVKRRFTEYSCRNAPGTILIENICNEKKECPEGDDEERCNNDVCRNHHLVVLGNKIQNYKNDRWGNMFGEILDTWKNKTTATIRVTENMGRASRAVLQKLVVETLHDLVQTYAELPKLTRRSNTTTFDTFLDLSRLIQDTLRDCSN